MTKPVRTMDEALRYACGRLGQQYCHIADYLQALEGGKNYLVDQIADADYCIDILDAAMRDLQDKADLFGTRSTEFIDALDRLKGAQDQIAKTPNFQARVQRWCVECFGETTAADVEERTHRHMEESIELAQACGATRQDWYKLIDYVYGRPAGDIPQEVGGVMVTLAALCAARKIPMTRAGETELLRCHDKTEAIRAKHATKPDVGPLPGKG